MKRFWLTLLAVLGSLSAALAQGAQDDRWSIYTNSDGYLIAGISKGDALLEVVCVDPESYVLVYSFPEDDLHSSLETADSVMLTQRITSGSYIGTMVPVARAEGRAVFIRWVDATSGMFKNIGKASSTIEMGLRLTDGAPERGLTAFRARGSTATMKTFAEQCANPSPTTSDGWAFNTQAGNIVFEHENGALFGVGCKSGGWEVFYTLSQLDLDSSLFSRPTATIVVTFVGEAPIVLDQALSIPIAGDFVAFVRPLPPDSPMHDKLAAHEGVAEISLATDGADPSTYRHPIRIPLSGLTDVLPQFLATPECSG